MNPPTVWPGLDAPRQPEGYLLFIWLHSCLIVHADGT